MDDSSSDPVTSMTFLALGLYLATIAVYSYVAFRLNTYRGPTVFWRSQRIKLRPLLTTPSEQPPPSATSAVAPSPQSSKPTRPSISSRFADSIPVNRRWAYIVLRTSQIHAIQTIRGSITGSIFFGQTAVMIVFLCLFFKLYTSRQHLMFLLIGMTAMGSMMFFVQNLRMAYHLNYLVMVLPRVTSPRKKEARAAAAEARQDPSDNHSAKLQEFPSTPVLKPHHSPSSPRGPSPSSPNSPRGNRSTPPFEKREPEQGVDQADVALPKALTQKGVNSPKTLLESPRATSPTLMAPFDRNLSTGIRAAGTTGRSLTPPARRRSSSAISVLNAPEKSKSTTAQSLRKWLETTGERKLPRPQTVLDMLSAQSLPKPQDLIAANEHFGEAALMHLMGKDNISFISPKFATLETHLQAEEKLGLPQHEERLADVLKLLSVNFALGVRMLIFTLPLVFGLFHDAALMVSSVLILIVLTYLDRLI